MPFERHYKSIFLSHGCRLSKMAFSSHFYPLCHRVIGVSGAGVPVMGRRPLWQSRSCQNTVPGRASNVRPRKPPCPPPSTVRPSLPNATAVRQKTDYRGGRRDAKAHISRAAVRVRRDPAETDSKEVSGAAGGGGTVILPKAFL